MGIYSIWRGNVTWKFLFLCLFFYCFIGNQIVHEEVGKLFMEIGIRKHKDIRTPVICNIFDTHGEVMAGVANVEAVVSLF